MRSRIEPAAAAVVVANKNLQHLLLGAFAVLLPAAHRFPSSSASALCYTSFDRGGHSYRSFSSSTLFRRSAARRGSSRRAVPPAFVAAAFSLPRACFLPRRLQSRTTMSTSAAPPGRLGDDSATAAERQRKQESAAESATTTAAADPPKRGAKRRRRRPRPPPRRKYRPGFNSYLKVVLDGASLGRLRRLAIEVRDRVADDQEQREEEEEEEGATAQTKNNSSSGVTSAGGNNDGTVRTEEDQLWGDSDNERNNNNKRSNNSSNGNRKKSPPVLKVKPRSEDSLHMTFFFGGEVLCELPAEELVEFHARVSALLLDNGFVQNQQQQQQESGAEDDRIGTCDGGDGVSTSQRFRVKEICLFPPRRNNLVVAVLEAPPLFQRLHDEIRSIAKNWGDDPDGGGEENKDRSGDNDGSTSPPKNALREIASYSKDNWTPHVTLANVYGGNEESKRMLRELLQDISQRETASADSDFLMEASGRTIEMGGPVPEQVELDWNFTLG